MTKRQGRKPRPIEYEPSRMDDLHLTPKEVADYLRTDVGTLANLRARGEGLPYRKPLGRVLYTAADVLTAAHREGRGYSRARMESAIATFPGLTDKQRKELIAHIQSVLWE